MNLPNLIQELREEHNRKNKNLILSMFTDRKLDTIEITTFEEDIYMLFNYDDGIWKPERRYPSIPPDKNFSQEELINLLLDKIDQDKLNRFDLFCSNKVVGGETYLNFAMYQQIEELLNNKCPITAKECLEHVDIILPYFIQRVKNFVRDNDFRKTSRKLLLRMKERKKTLERIINTPEIYLSFIVPYEEKLLQDLANKNGHQNLFV